MFVSVQYSTFLYSKGLCGFWQICKVGMVWPRYHHLNQSQCLLRVLTQLRQSSQPWTIYCSHLKVLKIPSKFLKEYSRSSGNILYLIPKCFVELTEHQQSNTLDRVCFCTEMTTGFQGDFSVIKCKLGSSYCIDPIKNAMIAYRTNWKSGILAS